MLDSLSSGTPETIRSPTYKSPANGSSRNATRGPRRPRRGADRRMRERRTAWIMMGLGIVLGTFEICIVLSYL